MNSSPILTQYAVVETACHSQTGDGYLRLERRWAWLTLSQFADGAYAYRCVNVGIVYVHPLSVKSNSPEGPLRRVPIRHTVYFL
jgi:hypothetical protein